MAQKTRTIYFSFYLSVISVHPMAVHIVSLRPVVAVIAVVISWAVRKYCDVKFINLSSTSVFDH